MVKGRVGGALGAIALAVALLAGAIQVQAAREREYPASLDVEDTVYITSGSALRRLSGAYNTLAADVYWIRAIQYYGGAKRRLDEQPLAPEPPPMLAAVESKEFNQLYTLLDITTTLDPRFDIAYRFGSVFLAEAYPAGAGRVDLAVAPLKGFSRRPIVGYGGCRLRGTGTHTTITTAAFSEGQRGARRTIVVKPARRGDAGAGGDRRSSRSCGRGSCNPRTSTGCEGPLSTVCSSCARSMKSTPFNRGLTRSLRPGAARRAIGRRSFAPGSFRAFQPIRPGRRTN